MLIITESNHEEKTLHVRLLQMTYTLEVPSISSLSSLKPMFTDTLINIDNMLHAIVLQVASLLGYIRPFVELITSLSGIRNVSAAISSRKWQS